MPKTRFRYEMKKTLVQLETVWYCDIRWKHSPYDLISSVLLRHLHWVHVPVFTSLFLSHRWDIFRGGNQSPDPYAGWTAFHRSAGIRSGSRLPDVRLLPRTAGTKSLFFLYISWCWNRLKMSRTAIVSVCCLSSRFWFLQLLFYIFIYVCFECFNVE